MNQNLADFIHTLSKSDYEVFEEIFIYKYHKLKKLYKVMKKYSDDISDLDYKETKRDTLKVEIKMSSKSDVKNMMKEIEKIIEDDTDVITVTSEKKVIHIEIIKNEEIDI